MPYRELAVVTGINLSLAFLVNTLSIPIKHDRHSESPLNDLNATP